MKARFAALVCLAILAFGLVAAGGQDAHASSGPLVWGLSDSSNANTPTGHGLQSFDASTGFNANGSVITITGGPISGTVTGGQALAWNGTTAYAALTVQGVPNSVLATLDLTTGHATTIAGLGHLMSGFTFAGSTLYAVTDEDDSCSSCLYSVNLTSGAVTSVGSLTSGAGNSIAFDPSDAGHLYHAAGDPGLGETPVFERVTLSPFAKTSIGFSGQGAPATAPSGLGYDSSASRFILTDANANVIALSNAGATTALSSSDEPLHGVYVDTTDPVPPNAAPVANADSATVVENDPTTPIDVRANDTDAEGDPIKVTAVTQPAHGTSAVIGGGAEISYQPVNGFCDDGHPSPDSFTYTLNGGSVGNVAVTVKCPGEGPVTYGVDPSSNTMTDPGLRTFDAWTGRNIGGLVITLSGSTVLSAAALAEDPTTSTSYAVLKTNTANDVLATLDLSNGQATNVATLTTDIAALAFTTDGNLFGVSPNGTFGCSNCLYQINKMNGSLSASTQLLPPSLGVALGFDPSNGKLYYASGSDPSSIFEQIDPTTKAITPLSYSGEAPNELGGLGFDSTNNRFIATDVRSASDWAIAPDGTTTKLGAMSQDLRGVVVSPQAPPTASDDTASMHEDDSALTIDVLANDADGGGGTKRVVSVSDPANGTAAVGAAGANVTYQPDQGYCDANTPDTFTYTLTGGSSATVSVSVACIDAPPTANDDTKSLTEDDPATTISVLANDTDPRGDPIKVISVTQPPSGHGSVAITNGGANVSYTPAANDCTTTTPISFTYTINGGDSANVSVSITCVDDPPVAHDDAFTVAENSGATTLDVLQNDNDVDGPPPSIASATQPTHGAVVVANDGSSLTYQPTAGYCGADTFTYTLNGNPSNATVSMTVTCSDAPPVANDDSFSVVKNSGATTFDVLTNDSNTDGGPMSIASTSTPPNGTVTIANDGQSVSYTPSTGFCSTTPDSFTYTLTPGSSTATVTVTVTCPNPAAQDDSYSVLKNSGATTLHVLDNDSDTTGGSIASASAASHGTVTIANDGQSVSYTPDTDFCSMIPDSFTYTLTPGSSTATVTVVVHCSDDPPVATNDSYTLTEDAGSTTLHVLDNDTNDDGGPMSIASLSGTTPSHATVTVANGGLSVTYTPAANYCGNDSFTYALTPGGSSATVSVTITCVNDPPVAHDDTFGIPQDSPATSLPVLANDTDAEGDAIAIQSIGSQPSNGTIVITGAGSGLTYQPDPGFNGDDLFTYVINGGSTGHVTVHVAPSTVTTIKLRYTPTKRTFSGVVGPGICAAGRTVSIFRTTAPTTPVAQTTSRTTGRFTVRKRVRRGAYFAVVALSEGCTLAQSKKVRVS